MADRGRHAALGAVDPFHLRPLRPVDATRVPTVTVAHRAGDIDDIHQHDHRSLDDGDDDRQRGGTPSAYDRVLATRYGLAAIDAVHDGAWGEMVVFREQRIERAPLAVAVGKTRFLDMAMYRDVASIFFG